MHPAIPFSPVSIVSRHDIDVFCLHDTYIIEGGEGIVSDVSALGGGFESNPKQALEDDLPLLLFITLRHTGLTSCY